MLDWLLDLVYLAALAIYAAAVVATLYLFCRGTKEAEVNEQSGSE